MSVDAPDVESVLFRSAVVAVGEYRCPPGHERFAGGHIDEPLVVFPRTAVIIDRRRRRSVYADPNTTVFYNANEDYSRTGVDRRGDLCDWFTVSPDVLDDIVAVVLPRRRTVEFPWTHASAPPRLYLWQRCVVDALEEDGAVDDVAVEEAVIGLLAACTRSAADASGGTAVRPRTIQSHAATVDTVRAVLAERLSDRLTLGEIADEAAVSVFHLCRLFRSHTGFTINEYLTQLRLRRSLDCVADPAVDLSRLALELGFCSHSHFTRRFAAAFGVPPSAMRGAPGGRLAEMRKIVKV